MREDMKKLCRHRLLALIRLNGLLRNARRLMKVNERAKVFVDEAKDVMDAFVEATE